MSFQWIQLDNAIPSSWKEIVKQDSKVYNTLLTLDHHLIKLEGVCQLKMSTKYLIKQVFTVFFSVR